MIAGGYIQRFSIFTFFILPFFYINISKKYSKFLIPILFLIFITGGILSGNSMPFILFIFSITLILIFQKQTRKYFLPFLVIFVLIFSILYNFNQIKLKIIFHFYFNINKMTSIIINKDFQNEHTPSIFERVFNFYDTWLMNKFIGGGIKNFRYYCHVRPNVDKDAEFICNMHPHNYYLEILQK